MIPTRLNQNVNDAYVAGFNRSNGKVILVNKHIPIPDEWPVTNFDNTVSKLAVLYPDFELISNFEVSEIIRITSNPLVFKGIDISKNRMGDIFINTRDLNNDITHRSQYRLYLSYNNKIVNSVEWRSIYPYGYYVLVKHVGVECE